MNRKWKQILDNQRNGQMVLFEYDYPDRSIIGDFDLRKGVISILKKQECPLKLIDLYCKLIEKFGIAYSLSDFRAALKDMEDEKIIKVDRTPSKTITGRPAVGFDYKKLNFRRNKVPTFP